MAALRSPPVATNAEKKRKKYYIFISYDILDTFIVRLYFENHKERRALEPFCLEPHGQSMLFGWIATYKSYLEYSEYGLQSPSEPAVLVECGTSLQDSESTRSKSNQTIKKIDIMPHTVNSKLEK